MKVLFVYPYMPRMHSVGWRRLAVKIIKAFFHVKDREAFLHSYTEMPFGISYIAAVLEKHGHAVALFVFQRFFDSRKFDAFLLSENPAVICFSAYDNNYAQVVRMAQFVRRHYPEIYMVLGGVRATLDPEGVLQDGFDAVCVGEGEYPTLELVEQLACGHQPSGIKNLWIKSSNGIEINEVRPFLPDLSALPFPQRSMWEPWFSRSADRSQSILLGRGCPFECTYCCNHALKNSAPGRYNRFRSIDSIIEEMTLLKKQCVDVPGFYFEVETITMDMAYAFAFAKAVARFNAEFPSAYGHGTNVRIVSGVEYGELFDAFVEAGFRYVHIGVESGSSRVRREVLRRDYSNDDVSRVIAQAKKSGLSVAAYVLVGVPGETHEDFEETITLLRECQPDFIYKSICVPYKGTQLYQHCVENGIDVCTSHASLERNVALFDLPGFSRRNIQKEYDWLEYNVYRKHRSRWALLNDMLLQKVRRVCVRIETRQV